MRALQARVSTVMRKISGVVGLDYVQKEQGGGGASQTFVCKVGRRGRTATWMGLAVCLFDTVP